MGRIFALFCLLLFIQPAQAKNNKIVKVSSPLEISMGSKDAPITIVEYTSLTCHHCAEFHIKVLPLIKEKYINTGKLRFVIMPYPMDSEALMAFQLINTLPEKKRDLGLTKAFASQERWIGHDSRVLTQILGMSNTQGKKALANKELENALLTCSYKAQKDLNIDATPAFFMGDKKVEGAPTMEEFDASYDELIKQKKSGTPS